MLAGIIVSEIPANLILQRLGAPFWLTVQMGIWGTIALTQAWCTGLSSFYATRFLLGIFEGGYIPGAQYMLALFYTEDELARRTAVFYFGNYLATAVGSLIAAAVLRLGGTQGLSGWQWLFISKFSSPSRCNMLLQPTNRLLFSRGSHYACGALRIRPPTTTQSCPHDSPPHHFRLLQ